MEYRTTLVDLFLFETKSLVGRVFFYRAPRLIKTGKNILNFGCGPNYIPGYVNADFFSLRSLLFGRRGRLEWYLDLRYPLNCEDDVFDGVFSEHAIEHLYPSDAIALIKELYRVMKVGAVVRITVPDLERYVSFYRGELEGPLLEPYASRFNTGCEAIRNMSQNYLHLSIWDYETLASHLAAAGFRNVSRKEYGVGDMPELLLDKKERAWETMYVEAIK